LIWSKAGAPGLGEGAPAAGASSLCFPYGPAARSRSSFDPRAPDTSGPWSRPSAEERRVMADLIYLVVGAAVLGVFALYALALKRI
jgi:hypothetical protein